MYWPKLSTLACTILPEDDGNYNGKTFSFNFNFKPWIMLSVYIVKESRVISRVYFSVLNIFPHLFFEELEIML
jgi:hypothetical protein